MLLLNIIIWFIAGFFFGRWYELTRIEKTSKRPDPFKGLSDKDLERIGRCMKENGGYWS